MIDVTDLLPRLMVYVPGCPDPVGSQALVDAAIAVCQEAHVLRVVVDPFDVVEGESEYDLEPPAQHDVESVLSVSLDGRALQGVPDYAVGPVPPEAGVPSYFYTRLIDDQRTLVLSPAPNADATGHIELAIKPKRTATKLHDELLIHWFEPILVRARATLCGIPGQPFTDQTLSQSLTSYGYQLTRQARVRANHGTTRGQTSVVPVPFV